MNTKQIVSIYFSPTGTTQKIVTTLGNTLAAQMNCPMKEINLTSPDMRKTPQFFSDSDLVVFGVPVIAGRVPNVLLKYLATLQGNGALAIPVVCYGNRNYDDALIELRNILEECNLHTIGGGAFIGEHSFSKILGAGRPDAADLEIAMDFAKKIADKVQNGNLNSLPINLNGSTPLRPYYQPRDRQGNPVNILKVTPKTSDSCTNCGICAIVCPMGSIDPTDVRNFVGICIKCGACVKKCPSEAKYYDDDGYLYHKRELELGFERRAEPEIFY